MITENTLHLYATEFRSIKILPRDITHIVYGADKNASILYENPGDGNTPYLKSPEADVWFKIVKLEIDQ